MYDVIVVGGGNAACAAAVSARENGAKRVVLLEKAPPVQRGGNTHFSGAIFRFVFNKVEELDRFLPGVEAEYPGFHAGVPIYPREAFREDLMRVTEGRSDPELADLLIDASYDTTCWMQDVGKHEFELARSAQKLDKPPYLCWAVTGGITFTFGGLKINKYAQVISSGWKPIEGLYCAGEMVGGLFQYNYPLGTGLMSGAVFGRIAGRSAARVRTQ